MYCEPFGPERLCLFRHEDHKHTLRGTYTRSVDLAVTETQGRCARPVSRYMRQVCLGGVPIYGVEVHGQSAKNRQKPEGRSMKRKQCRCVHQLWSHARSLKHMINTIRESKDDYETIVSDMQSRFEAMPWADADEGIDLLFNYWKLHRESYMKARRKKVKDDLIVILRILTKTLILYCQMNIITYAGSPDQRMSWQKVWSNIKRCTVLVRCSSQFLPGRWLKTRLGCIGNSKSESIIEDTEKLLETDEHVVYYIASPFNKHGYVGQTKDERGWSYRAQEEIRTAKKVFYMRKKAPLYDFRTVERRMGVLGFFSWVILPVVTLGKETTLNERQRVEEDVRRRLQPTMNSKNNPLAHLAWRKSFRYGKVQRPPRWARETPARRKKYKRTIKQGTKFMVWKDMKWNNLVGLHDLLKMSFTGDQLRIKKCEKHAHNDQTNYDIIMEQYAQSTITTTVGGKEQMFTLDKFTSLKSNRDEELEIHVKKNWRRNGWKKRLIEKLLLHRNTEKKLLKVLTFPQLYDVFAAADAYAPAGPDNRRVKKILHDYMTKGWKDKSFNKPESFNVKYLYDHRIEAKELEFIAKKILHLSALGPEAKRMIEKKMRVVAKNRSAVKAMLVNNKRAIENFTADRIPTCVGGEWCRNGEHFQAKLEDIDDTIARKFQNITTNIILPPTKGQLKHNVRRAIIDFINPLRKVLEKPPIRRPDSKYTKDDLRASLQSLNINDIDVERVMKRTQNYIAQWKGIKASNTAIQLTMFDIHKLKRKLHGLVISERDKNETQLYCECPVIHYQRLERMFYKLNNYEKITDESKQQIISRMRTMFNIRGLKKISPWTDSGTLPVGFVNPKEKALQTKERGIASYFKHPMRKTFKRAGKVLTWLLRQLPLNVPHFTLHKLHNLKNRVAEAQRKLKARYGSDTSLIMFCSDVKQMFTFLSHRGIEEALEWLFTEVSELKQYTQRGGIDRTPRKTRKNKMTLVVETNEVYWGEGNHEGHLKDRATGGPEDVITFSFSDLRSIITMDLNFTYSTVGQTILKQKQGCPIGGILSSFYANLYCAKQEYNYMTSSTLNRKDRIYGIRQIDDLVMWVAYNKRVQSTRTEAEQLIAEMLDKESATSQVYCDGLTIEEEPFELTEANDSISFNTDFAGTVISGNMDATEFKCKTLNKNWESIRIHNKQKKARYPPENTYAHDRMKMGVIIGSAVRIETQNTTEYDLIRSMKEMLFEMKVIGYDKRFLMKAMHKVKKKRNWKPRMPTLLYYVNRILYASTPNALAV